VGSVTLDDSPIAVGASGSSGIEVADDLAVFVSLDGLGIALWIFSCTVLSWRRVRHSTRIRAIFLLQGVGAVGCVGRHRKHWLVVDRRHKHRRLQNILLVLQQGQKGGDSVRREVRKWKVVLPSRWF